MNCSGEWALTRSCKFQHTLICWIGTRKVLLGVQDCPLSPFNPYGGGGVKWTLLTQEKGEERKNERRKIICGWFGGWRKLLPVRPCSKKDCCTKASTGYNGHSISPHTRAVRAEERAAALGGYSLFICMLAGLCWLWKEKTCNCFYNLNNISSLETPREKSFSSWQVTMAWW